MNKHKEIKSQPKNEDPIWCFMGIIYLLAGVFVWMMAGDDFVKNIAVFILLAGIVLFIFYLYQFLKAATE